MVDTTSGFLLSRACAKLYHYGEDTEDAAHTESYLDEYLIVSRTKQRCLDTCSSLMLMLSFRLNYKNVSIITQCLIVLEILEDVVKCTLGTPSGTLTRYPGDNSICLVK